MNKSNKLILLSFSVILIFTAISMFFRLDRYPVILYEGGVIETLSALGYFFCISVMLYKGGSLFLKRYHYLIILLIMFGLRELDFDKRFTTMGILKSKFLFSETVPVTEKVIGAVFIAILIYAVLMTIRGHFVSFIDGLKKTDPLQIGVLTVIFLLVFTKSIDGIGRKLQGLGFYIDQQTSDYFGIAEEMLELGIPVMILTTCVVYFSKKHIAKSV